ncbi:gamma carbonic anhydrase family protein [Microbacterium suaedae]|uniref:gamma carbonic anhydrase family protein n=1 Tax=Microbacterium suaedae TaxID=2067813 RepID=UPI000DA17DFD|nr:gamma carbonic anhydrase family protein [Microbacterium suaedae]
MTVSDQATVRGFRGAIPEAHETAYVAEGARIIGDVAIAEEASVWCNAVLRGDVSSIRIGRGSNLQDNVTVHVDAQHPTVLGDFVSVGHGAVVHGCEIGDGSLIGMGSVVLSGARIGASCLVAGGAVVLEGTEIPPRSLVAGVPAKVRRALTDEEVARIRDNAVRYVGYAKEHAAEM